MNAGLAFDPDRLFVTSGAQHAMFHRAGIRAAGALAIEEVTLSGARCGAARMLGRGTGPAGHGRNRASPLNRCARPWRGSDPPRVGLSDAVPMQNPHRRPDAGGAPARNSRILRARRS